MPLSAGRCMRCLVLDDHQLVGQAVGGLLGELCGLEAVDVCSSVSDAVERIGRDRPDLLILDVQLPGERWQEAVTALQCHSPGARLIFLTALGSRFQPPVELRPLVLAVVDKARALQELVGVVNAWQQSDPARGAGAGAARAPLEPAFERLSPRELRVFRALGKGLLNKQIAQELGLSLATVETYRKSLSAKLGLSGAELVRAAVLHRVSAGGGTP